MTDKRIRRGRTVATLLAVALVAAIAAPSIAQTRRALIASGDNPDLMLLYTGDVIGYVDPCG